MTKKETASGKIADLRKRAEEIAQKKVGQSQKKLEAMQSDEVLQTLDELRVHQVELEMQNEELHRPGGHPNSPTCGHLKIPHPMVVFKV